MEQAHDNLSAVVDAMFDSGSTSYTTTTGVAIDFKPVNIKRIGKMTEFINTLLQQVGRDKVEALAGVIADEQQRLMSEGKSAYALDIGGLVKRYYDNSSLLLTVFGLVADVLPGMVVTFTNMSEDQFNELGLDEQIVVATGVFAVNYGFFTQSLPPIIKRAMSGLASKKSAAGGKLAVTATK